jgi:hypothetical protein
MCLAEGKKTTSSITKASSPYVIYTLMFCVRCLVKSYQILALIAACSILSGCILPRSGEVVLVPEFEGIVLDSASNQPIEGALLKVDNRPESSVTTQSDGSFHMKEIRHSYYIMFLDPGGGVSGYLPPAGRIYWLLKTSHPLYRNKDIYLREYIVPYSKKPRDPLIIRLEPK